MTQDLKSCVHCGRIGDKKKLEDAEEAEKKKAEEAKEKPKN